MTMRPSIRRIFCTFAGLVLTASIAAEAQTTSSRIVYQRAGEIWKMKDDGTGQTRLTNPDDADFRPTICPSGRIIVFERTTSFELYRIDQNGNSEENLTNSGAYEGDPDCGKYGSNTYIVYSSDEDGNDGDIFRMDVHGDNVHQLTENGDLEGQPTWCGNHQVAFARHDSTEDGDDWEIWLMDVSNGGNPIKLTVNGVHDQEPACRPSGDFVVFQRDPASPLTEVDIWRLDLETLDEVNITASVDFDALFPTYSPAGAYLAFAGAATGTNFNIYKMEAEPDAEEEPLTSHTDYEVQPDWSELVP